MTGWPGLNGQIRILKRKIFLGIIINSIQSKVELTAKHHVGND